MSNASELPLIVLTDPIDHASREALERVARLRLVADREGDELASLAAQASIIIVRSPVPAALLTAAARLVGLVRYGAGVDMIPVAEASRLGVAVANAPEANARSVAEYALGQMLSLARKLNECDRLLRLDGWNMARGLSRDGYDLQGKTLAIIGMGSVGSQLARMSRAGLDMRVLGVRRSMAPLPPGVERATLDDALREADVVVLACPLSEETRGFIDARRLRLMKPTAWLINVSRGPVVDEAALVRALAARQLGGAALDVFNEEPMPPGSPLLQTPNLILSPHLAGITRESLARIGRITVEQTLALLEGRLPSHLVNREAARAILARMAALGLAALS